jgi:type III secretion protein J
MYSNKAKQLLLQCILTLLLTGCGDIELYSDLSEKEANEMLALLQKNSIEAKKIRTKKGLITLEVDNSEFASAMSIFKRYGYPRQNFGDMEALFEQNGMISTPSEERSRLIYGTSQEISKTLSTIDGVVSVRVHIAHPDEEQMTKNKADFNSNLSSALSASVLIRYRPEIPINHLAPQIKLLTANAVKGLDYKNVSVIFIPVIAEGTTEDMIVPRTDNTVYADSEINSIDKGRSE